MNSLLTLTLFLLAVAFLFRVDFIFYIVYVCLGLYAWSRWVIPYRLRQVQIKRTFQDHAFWGDVMEVKLKIENRSLLRIPWLEVSESVAVQLNAGHPVNSVIALKPKKSADFQYRVSTHRRGYYRIGPTRLTSGDLFGLNAEQMVELPAEFLTIYPKITPIEQLRISSRLPFGTIISKQQLFEDPARPTGVRDFRSGDSIRQINWKVSAHTQNLMVKTLQPAIYLETMIVLNLSKNDVQHWDRTGTIEWSVELAASLAAHLHRKRQPVGLASNGVDPLQSDSVDPPEFDPYSGRLLAQIGVDAKPLYSLPPNNGRAHLMKLLERLARIEATEQFDFNTYLRTNSLPLSWGGTALVITPYADDGLCQTLHHWVRRGINPILIVVEPNDRTHALKDRARQLGFVAVEAGNQAELETAFR